MANIDKLNKLASNNSQWIIEAKKRKTNRFWQKHSQKIAIEVLRTIRKKGIKQKQLAEMIGVSAQQINKIVKGNENLTLMTIAKLENALNIELIFTENKTHIIHKEYVTKPLFFHIYSNTKIISKQIYNYEERKEIYSENVVNEKNVNYG